MIGVKTGTQTWSTSKQTVDFNDQEKGKTLTKEEREKHFGGAELDEILNKAADPNWVDPAKVQRKVGGADLDKDAFLKMFLAHLKNQDPTNPMQSYEMAAQLAQFTSLEKLDGINSGIENMVKANDNKSKNSFEVLKLIGKEVSGDSAKIYRNDEEEVHEINFVLQQDAVGGEVEIHNANGQVVRKLNLGKMKAGKNQIVWKGELDNGNPGSVGEYKVVINPKSSNGSKLNAETKFSGKVTGVNYTAQGPVLMVGKQSIRLNEIKGISEPVAPEKRIAVHQVDAQGDPKLENEASKKPNLKKFAIQPENNSAQGNLGDVGMSQGLVNKLTKQLNKTVGM